MPLPGLPTKVNLNPSVCPPFTFETSSLKVGVGQANLVKLYAKAKVIAIPRYEDKGAVDVMCLHSVGGGVANSGRGQRWRCVGQLNVQLVKVYAKVDEEGRWMLHSAE